MPPMVATIITLTWIFHFNVNIRFNDALKKKKLKVIKSYCWTIFIYNFPLFIFFSLLIRYFTESNDSQAECQSIAPGFPFKEKKKFPKHFHSTFEFQTHVILQFKGWILSANKSIEPDEKKTTFNLNWMHVTKHFFSAHKITLIT